MILRYTSGGGEEQEKREIVRSLAGGDPTGWFERLYRAGAAGELDMPWGRTEPNSLLARWAAERGLGGTGQRAVVVGCGQGADAEYVASLGFQTVGFDIAETAIRLARQRYPGSAVRYRVADLLDPPVEWRRAFDLVVEIITVQALPDPPRHQAIVNVGRRSPPAGRSSSWNGPARSTSSLPNWLLGRSPAPKSKPSRPTAWPRSAST